MLDVNLNTRHSLGYMKHLIGSELYTTEAVEGPKKEVSILIAELRFSFSVASTDTKTKHVMQSP